MNHLLKISLHDSKEEIKGKLSSIQDLILEEESTLYDSEITVIKNILENIEEFLPKDLIFDANAVLFYTFMHSDRDMMETYVSPHIYLTKQFTAIYEVFEPDKYKIVSPDANIIEIPEIGFYCEVPLVKILKFVGLEEILQFWDKYLNIGYYRYSSISNRLDFINRLKK